MAKKRPRISVVMSVYNDAPFLAAAITSILTQSVADFEFLIVDDGSSDGSAKIIDDYAQADHRIRVLRQENRGLIASLNRAIAEACGELIARMDGDDISLPERFAQQLAFIDAHPDCGVLGTNFHSIDAAGRLVEVAAPHPLDHAGISDALRRDSPICHPSVMMQRAALLSVGGYRPAYRFGEDYDLWLRLSTRTRLANLPDRLLHYRRSDNQVSVCHAVDQQISVAVALLAHAERLAARPDPTAELLCPPSLDQLDALFGKSGLEFDLRSQLARRIGYSRHAMRADGFDILVAHVRAGGGHEGLWRTVARLLLFGEFTKALRLATLLVVSLHRPSARSWEAPINA